MVKVSVIVPVYNVEEYLERCLLSLVNQSLQDMEIIVVNDGSPDNSQTIIEKFAAKYKNIKSYIKENGGLSDARNYGIKKAVGEYIAFVDSDDYVSEQMYEQMYQKAKERDFDLVVCDLNYIYPDKIVPAYSKVARDTTDIKKCMLNIYPAVWNKIFKRELFLDGIEFKKDVWFEDVEFIYRLLPRVKSIGTVHKNFVQYVQRKGSITDTVNRKIYDYIDNWNGIVEYYQFNDLYNEFKNELEYTYVRYIYATFIKQACSYDYSDYLEAVTSAITNVERHFPNYRKNRYFHKSLKGLYLVFFNKPIAKIYYKLKKMKKRKENLFR
ncbi:MAG: glycosyltransferase [Erysipelotrichia bacterium]|nr:glycosyltransferase [Erysipelotrichia bacterium]